MTITDSKATVRAKPVRRVPAEPPQEAPHSYVPDRSIADRYVHRKVNGVNDFYLMDYCMDNQLNVIFRGPTGSGKTMMPRAFAAERGLNYYAVPCDISLEPTALLGRMMPTKVAGRFRWQDGPVTELARLGGVLDLSEVNMASQRVMAALFPLLDERRELPLLQHEGEIVRAHERLLVVADCNPGYRSTQELNEAFLNRFAMKVSWGYSDQVEAELVKLPRLLEAAKQIRKSSGIRTDVSTNSMMTFVQIAVDLGYKAAVSNFVEGFLPMERASVEQTMDAHSAEMKVQITALQSQKAGKGKEQEVPKENWDPAWDVKPTETAGDFEFVQEKP
jgi:hypothetical protein